MAFDDTSFRGGLAKSFPKLRLTAPSNQLQLGDGAVLNCQATAGRVITFQDKTGTVVLSSDVRAFPVSTPTFGATVSIDPTLANVFVLNGVSTTSATCTLNLATAPPAGQTLTFVLNASASGTVTYTFGTSFRSTGTGAPTASKTLVVEFVSDGTSALETARTSALLA